MSQNAPIRRQPNGRRKETKKPATPLDRVPPYSLQAEECLLGCLLIKPDVYDEVNEIIGPEDFFDEGHQVVYRHIMQLRESNRQLDVPLLVEHLKQHKDLERVGGILALGRFANAVPHAAFAVDYARTVRELALRRRLIDVSTESLLEAYDGEEEAAKLIERAENRVFSIVEDDRSGRVRVLRDVIHEALDRLDARLKGDRSDVGAETGFVDLDDMTGGLHRSELTILAARPSMGKTALALNIAEHVAIHDRIPVLFVSLEMSRLELVDRLLCSRAKVDGSRLRKGQIPGRDQKRIVDVAGQIRDAPLHIDDTPSRSVVQIAGAARRTKRGHGHQLGLIVIDYLQLVEPDNPRDPRQEQVARITRRLKMLARDLEVPVLCLAQLNRQAELTKDNRPKLSHLRESGAIEQDADTVVFIHREEYYLTGEEKAQYAGQATLIVAKQRNGPVGEVPLHFHDKYARFSNAERREREADFNVFREDEPESPF